MMAITLTYLSESFFHFSIVIHNLLCYDFRIFEKKINIINSYVF